MAKQLTMNKNPMKEEVSNSSVAEIAKLIYLEEISLSEPFQSLFPMETAVLEAIVEDMNIHGFDKSKPVNVWKKDDGTLVLIDGYTRVQAAKKSGVTRIPVFENHFNTESDALEYALKVQKNRRNLSDSSMLRLIEMLDMPTQGFRGTPLAPHGANGNIGRKSSEILGDKLGVSSRTIERGRAVLKEPALAEEVRKGKISIPEAERKIRKQKSIDKEVDHENVIEAFLNYLKTDENSATREYWKGVSKATEALRLFNMLPSSVHSRIRPLLEQLDVRH